MAELKDIQAALELLAQAKTAGELTDAHRAMYAEVRRKRRADKTEYGDLAQTFVAAMANWDAQKKDGVSKEDRIADLEKTLRVAWPQGRAEPWHYKCDLCDDTGWKRSQCDGDTFCGRENKHAPHDYVVACWCDKGRQFIPKPKSADDFTSAGKSPRKKRDFNRMGS